MAPRVNSTRGKADPHGSETPSSWVARFARLVPAGPVLDIAAGRGRHSRLFAQRGHKVTAIDRDVTYLTGLGAPVEIIQADLETPGGAWPLGNRRFAGIVVTNYLHRPLFPSIRAALAPGGVLIYETFAIGNERFGKPNNPNFLLKPGELLELAAGLRVLAYEDLEVSEPAPAMVQRIVARSG